MMHSVNSQNQIKVDIIKLNHLLNARKITLPLIKNRQKSLYLKLKKNKNFKASLKELNFINAFLSIPTEKIIFKDLLPDYILMKKEEIIKTKRPIMRDGIHFYNYYSLPAPYGYIGPVILDILCPKNKMPKLNNGHLEQAITVNIGNNDIYGRWGESKNRINFSRIRFNNTKKNPWIIGDTYVEPTYCPHTYSRATDYNSQILSYTAKSPIEKLVKTLNGWSIESYKNFLNRIDNKDIRISVLNLYMDNKAMDIKYLSKKINHDFKNLKQIINNKKILNKICGVLDINYEQFSEKKYKYEDKIGKTYLSYKESFKTIRNYKSYTIASMASSKRFMDMFGYFIKVDKKKEVKDLSDFASSHYLVTGGNILLNIDKKRVKLKKGDAIWMSSFKKHGFSGNGSLLKISNGENIDASNLSEMMNLFKPKKTLERAYKDKISWGYE